MSCHVISATTLALQLVIWELNVDISWLTNKTPDSTSIRITETSIRISKITRITFMGSISVDSIAVSFVWLFWLTLTNTESEMSRLVFISVVFADG